jgi:hypothetical protein
MSVLQPLVLDMVPMLAIVATLPSAQGGGKDIQRFGTGVPAIRLEALGGACA